MPLGKILWTDLTVPNTEAVRDFYAAVASWSVQKYDDDYNMLASDGNPAAGICHPVGQNASLPPQWLIYITVADLDASIAACQQHGGSVINGPRGEVGSRFCVIRDPAGAVAALIEASPEA
jgi:predicted enzyme related to lactoylglutathione lyase